ncbi:MAG: hypothetical protein LBR13_00160 [Dysgonamonadaceae bacterium]|jgi:hypothetical protein|nr:hypothetical protein [Dysgonamonadaceae bacterium]
MIRYFNPGHETAVLNGSPYYRQPMSVAKMQRDLASLPKWYSNENDIVWNEYVEPISSDIAKNQPVDLWGISPQSVHYFEKISAENNLNLQIPAWKEEFRYLGSRFTAQKTLSILLEKVPETDRNILPCFCSSLREIEHKIEKADSDADFLIKAPYSSSGRGLLRLPKGRIAQSEKQIIGGMLKKQQQVSIEKFLDKVLDFSMHFEINAPKNAVFIGYSIFYTNQKGVWQRSLLANQDMMREILTKYVENDLLEKVKTEILSIFDEIYSPYYQGNIGVDMMIYNDNGIFRLHPCVEINMRKSMGFVALKIFEKQILPTSQGFFSIIFDKNSEKLMEQHLENQKSSPLIMENSFIKSGYTNLCPLTETTNYLAFIAVFL